MRAITESTCEVSGGSVSLQEMALWIARPDLDVIVLEPPELAEQLTVVAARLTRAAARLRMP